MCLLVVLHGVLPDVPLLVAANRDERYDRPSQSMAVLRSDEPRTLGGRDEVSGGTWLAVNEHGVVAGLTNCPLPDGSIPDKRSRGELPLVLTGLRTAEEAVDALAATVRPDDYNPCWLLVGDRRTLFSVDMTGSLASSATIGAGPTNRVRFRLLDPGLHVLENRPIDAPSAKVDHVTAQVLRALVADRREMLVSDIQAMLADHQMNPGPSQLGPSHSASGSRLDAAAVPATAGAVPPAAAAGSLTAAAVSPAPGSAPATRARPPELSACCVHMPAFGTRSSVVVSVPAAPGVLPSLLVADGPPCSSPFVEAGACWGDRWPGLASPAEPCA